MEQAQYYPITLYMNAEFVENYLNPFLELAPKDKTLEIKKILKRHKKKGKPKQVESISPCIRALIKKYVDHQKSRILNKPEEPKEDTNAN